MKRKPRLTIAFLSDNLSDAGDYHVNLWNGVLDEAENQGLSVQSFIGGCLDRSPWGEFDASRNLIWESFDPLSVDGIVFTGGSLGNYTSLERWEAFCQRLRAVPVVSVTPTLPEIPFVTVDNSLGLQSLLNHLIQTHGSKRIAFISGPMTNADALTRFESWHSVMKDHGLPFDSSLVYDGDWVHASGAKAVDEFLKLSIRPDAIVAANDNMAVGALQRLHDLGIVVPDEMIVCGFDDTDEARTTVPQITTVRQPIYQIGRKAVSVLIDKIHGQLQKVNSFVLPSVPIFRESCGCGIRENRKKIFQVVGDLETKLVRTLKRNEVQKLARIGGGEIELWLRRFARAFRSDEEGILLSFEDILKKSDYDEMTSFFEDVLDDAIAVVLENIDFIDDVRKALRILLASQRRLYKKAEQNQKTVRLDDEKLLYHVMESAQFLSGSADLDDLQSRIRQALPRFGILGLSIIIMRKIGEVEQVLSVTEAKIPAITRQESQSDVQMHLDASMESETERFFLVLPLFSREERYGIAVFTVRTRNAVLYETLGLQLSTSLKAISSAAKIHESQELLFQMQKMESIGQLTAGIAHDFNNLLTSVLNYNFMLLRKLKENDPLRLYAERIETAGKRASDLVAGLLAFGRGDHMTKSHLELNESIRNHRHLMEILVPKGIQLTVDLAASELNVEADESKLIQVILNLVGNARDAMGETGNITVGTTRKLANEDDQRRLQLVVGREYATIDVKDDGPGVPPQYLSKIFEPFFTTKSVGKGTGLGLAVAFGVAKQHNGAIEVESAVGVGACFRVWVPLLVKANSET